MSVRLKIMSRRYMNNARMRKLLDGRYIIPTSFSSTTLGCVYVCVYVCVLYIITRCYTLSIVFLLFRRNSQRTNLNEERRSEYAERSK